MLPEKLAVIFTTLALALTLAESGLSPPESGDEVFSVKDPNSRRNVMDKNGEDLPKVPCDEMNESCSGCIALGHCKFANFNNSETRCVEKSMEDATVENLVHGFTLVDVEFQNCPESGDVPENHTVEPKFGDDNSTTISTEATSTTADISTNPETTPSTTAPTTTTTTTTTTTVKPETTSTAAPTTSSGPVSTTEKPKTGTSPLQTTPVNPDSGKTGSHFDGWSFFGGILLTIGVSAIAFISFKYYKVRSGGSSNYNRF